jgi:DNA-binding transcriptional ArsR family regulator
MGGRLREDVEEVVLSALGHRERRRILEVVGSSPDGVLYSDILHELGMNTGKLNYHLKLLEGVIERDESRRYRLSALGERAMRLLGGLTEDLDEESVRRFSSVRASQDEFVEGVVGWYFNFVIVGTFTFFLGVVSLFWLGMGRTFDPGVVYAVVGVSAVCFVGLTWWLLRVRREAPERIIGFLQRMGLYRGRG